MKMKKSKEFCLKMGSGIFTVELIVSSVFLSLSPHGSLTLREGHLLRSCNFNPSPLYHMLNMLAAMHILDLFCINCPGPSILSQAWHRPWVPFYSIRNKGKSLPLIELLFVASVAIPAHAFRTTHICIVFNAADLLFYCSIIVLGIFLCL
jgi:hypothetical protein